jgi:hypothetical protein
MADQSSQSKTVSDNNQVSLETANQVDVQPPSETAEMSRRDIIKLTAGAVVAAPLVGLNPAQGAIPGPLAQQKASQTKGKASQTKAPLFFTREELALVDELTELIIPSDAHSPGARAAQVAAYIDRRLAEAFEEEPKKQWRDGLKLIETISREMHGHPFLQATPAERIALLTRISKNETNPTKPEELFFKELKSRTAHAYYTSKIGIHQEMQYKGNTYLKEFIGYDAK